MLREFSELVAKRAGTLDWVTIATIIITLIQQCLDQPDVLEAAFERPLTWRQQLALQLQCVRAHGMRMGLRVSREIRDGMKPYKDSKAGYGPRQFEEALLREVKDFS